MTKEAEMLALADWCEESAAARSSKSIREKFIACASIIRAAAPRPSPDAGLVERLTEIAYRDEAKSVTVSAADLRALLSTRAVVGEPVAAKAWADHHGWSDVPGFDAHPAPSGRDPATIEACAKVCDDLRHVDYSQETAEWSGGTFDCARAIRALAPARPAETRPVTDWQQDKAETSVLPTERE